MIVYNSGQKISLNQNDYLATGGEGIIYKKGNTVYKITNIPLPRQKFKELSVLTDPNIIKPENILLNDKSEDIGYTMPLVSGDIVCRLFTKSFKDRNGISNNNILNSIYNFRKIIDFIHSKDVLVVDLNEMNFIYNKENIYAIDVAGYQTKSYPAKAIADSIRFWPQNSFSKDTDWYSWGVVTFQMFIGIHPYKGKHPKYTQKLLENMKQRCIDHVSVFNKQVSIPDCCEDFDTIPIGLKDWYFSLFEKGKLSCPPSNFDKIIKKNDVQITSQALDITEEKITDIVSVHNIGGLVVRGKLKTYWGNKVLPRCDLIFSCNLIPVLVYDNTVYYNGIEKQITIDHINKIVINNKLYLVTETELIEVKLNVLGTNFILTYNKACSILSQCLKYGDGCILQNLFGEWSLVPGNIKLPFKGKLVDCKLIDDILFAIFDNKTYLYNITTKEVKELNCSNINFTKHNNIIVAVTNDGICLMSSNKEKVITNHGLKNLNIISCGDMYAYNSSKLFKIKVK